MSKTRLLFVVHSLCMGGTERLVTQLSQALPDSQYEIGICCLDSRGTLWEQCAKEEYSLFELHRKPGWQFRTFKAAADVINEFKPDVIHAHQYTPYVYAALGRLISRSKAKIILTEHGRHFPDIVSPKRRIANIILKRFATRITAVSEFSKKALQANEGFSRSPIQVVYNGLADYERIGVDDISLHKELGLDSAVPLIGYIGSLREVKNPAYLLEVFAKLAKVEELSRLVFIGDGPLRAELEAMVNSLELSERVYFLGTKNPATPYISSLTVFALPSLSEAASLALLEAMARAVPVIATETGGTPELVANGRNGVLVPVNDSELFAQQLHMLLKEPKRRANLGELAKLEVENRFSFENMLNSYKQIYEELH